jgi:DNA-binding response OmpR family regulator
MTPAPAGRQRVLIIDDEERIREVLVRILHRCDIDADAAADGAEAIGLVESRPYDLVILDLLMPGQHGFSVLTEITRRRPGQAVLVLSCLTDPQSKVESLYLGADDYVPKPFHVAELVARVRARLRATGRPAPTMLTRGRLTLDVLHRRADTGAGPIPLTEREFQLLWELVRAGGEVISKADLLARVWRYEPGSASNVVDVYIGRLRSRLGADVITTVRGQGYGVGSCN